MEEKYVITIARQFASMGRSTAKQMSEKLGIQFYDKDIVNEAAQKLKMPSYAIEENEESATKIPTSFLSRWAFPLGGTTTSVQDEIFEAQKDIITFLTKRESCIIVGRCSDYILRDHPRALHVYIYAPYEARLKNAVDDLGFSEEEAKRIIKEVDESRSAYYKHYAGYLPEDKNYKNIMVDSSILGVEGTADYLVDLVKRKFDI